MSDSTSGPIKVPHPKKKSPRAAPEEIRALQQTHKRQVRSLVECIHHLSINCKGQNLELDNRLAKLRAQLSDEPELERVLPDVANICRSLQNQTNQTQKEVANTRQKLLSLADQLSSLTKLPTPIKRELTIYQNDVKTSLQSLWEFLPKVSQLLDLYQNLLKSRLLTEKPLEVVPKHHRLSHELAQLLTEIDFNSEQRHVIDAIKAELAGSINAEQLLDAYHQVLTMLLDDMARQRSISQQFLLSLQDSLASVKEAVLDDWNQTVHSFGQQRVFNKNLAHNCSQLSETVEHADDLEMLKQNVMTELQSIRERLQARDEEVVKELAQLKETSAKMRQELEALSSEAASYRDQLTEHQRLNTLDTLTQLPNRAALDERLKREYRNVRRYGNDLWVAVADIDHFKSINDTYGHTTGDKTLQVVAMALKNSLRKGEFVARYGGEEFVLLLPDVSEAKVVPILNRIRERIKSIPFKFRNKNVTVTISMGSAQVTQGETIQEAFERADAALYRAKRQGRNRVEIDKLDK